MVADFVETVGSHEGKIKAYVYKEWELGYGGVDVYFDTDSLSIVY
ncbi:hypothetical protein WGM54_18435 [Paenibacillus polymyxa]